MKIRITKGRGWYEDLVGGIYEVIERNYHDNGYNVEHPENDHVVTHFVRDGNYEIIDEETPQADAVNSPQHYTNGRFETIEIIEEITQGYDNGYVAYLVGNTLKYLARAPYKHDEPTEDLRKAERYIAFAIEHLTKEDR